MINFEKIEWKNLLSTGNETQEVELNNHSRTMVVGKNGHGKSTLIDALTFALYGKPFRSIKKDKLINAVNKKDCLVSIYFSIGSNKYVITRGIKPNIFEIYINDSLINQDAKVKDYQKYLEKNILQMNFQTFTQVVVLGSSSYIPFMKLSTSHRRELVEDLLDIKIFGSMNLILKSKYKTVLESHKEIDSAINLLSEKIKMNEINLTSIRNRSKVSVRKHNDRIKDNNEKIKNVDIDIKKLNSINKNLSLGISNLSDITSKNKNLNVLNGQLLSKLRNTNKSIKFYSKNESCPECKQGIDSDFKSGILEERYNLKNELDSALTKMSLNITDSNEKLNNINSINTEIQNNELSIEVNNSIRKSLINLNKNIEIDISHESESLDEIIELEKSISSKKETLNKLNKRLKVIVSNKEYMSVMKLLLADDGVKSSIIKKYVPLINKTINSYLSSMEFHARFNLDEEFNETIFSRYIDQFSYANFSEGEKSRIDLALLFTWRKIAKMKNSGNTNLLIIDEIFDSSLDGNGTEEFMKILYTLENENVFVISHKNHMAERFDNVITFKKTGNFSRRI